MNGDGIVAMDVQEHVDIKSEKLNNPGINLLDGSQVIRQINKKLCPPSREQKQNYPENTEEERNTILKQRELLKEMLEVERIERQKKRAVATYIDGSGLIEVKEFVGKVSAWGYTMEKRKFLHPFEALYLIEMNLLELYYHSNIVSLEQAYAIILNMPNSLTYDQYYVFSYLSRLGLSVYLHQNDDMDVGNYPAIQIEYKRTKKLSQDTELVWDCLKEMLGQTTNPALQKNDAYISIKSSMTKIAGKISDAKNDFVNESEWEKKGDVAKDFFDGDHVPVKRSFEVNLENSESSKKVKIKGNSTFNSNNQFNSLNLDVLKDDPSYEKYRELFEEITVIECGNDDIDDQSAGNSIQYDFDLYQSPKSKKNPHPPDFRVIIRRSDQPLPKRGNLAALLRSSAIKPPIILIIVSEVMSLQTFLYKL